MLFIDPANVPDTGHPMIDEGHHRLTEIVNAIYVDWSAGETARLASASRRFLVTLRQHFRQEEAVMDDVGLPSTTDHRRTHAAVLEEFERLIGAMQLAASPPAAAMVDFFSAAEKLVWDHEMVDDQDFWAYFAGRGVAPDTLIVADAPAILDHPDLDRDHAALVGLINDLHGGLRQALSPSVLMARAAGLRAVASAHFAREEAIMARLPDMPGHDDHRRQHESLLAELDHAMEDMAYGRRATLDAMIGTYLRDWLLEHISIFDRPLVAALRAAEDGTA